MAHAKKVPQKDPKTKTKTKMVSKKYSIEKHLTEAGSEASMSQLCIQCTDN